MSMDQDLGITLEKRVLLVVGMVFAGLAAFQFARRAIRIIRRPISEETQLWQFDEHRLIQVRRDSWIFAWFEPLIRGLAEILDRSPWLLGPAVRKRMEMSLLRAYGNLRQTAEEFLAIAIFQAVIAAFILFPVLRMYLACELSLVLTAVSVPLLVCGCMHELARKGRMRLQAIKRRLPFCVDLLALMVDAGATPLEALASVVTETKDSPAGAEMAVVLRQTNANQTFISSLQQMRERLRDPEVDEVIMAVTNGDSLGTPLSEILLSLADQMRMRRVQRLEKMAGQAQTMMAIPGFIAMCTCLLIAVAPFALEYFYKQ